MKTIKELSTEFGISRQALTKKIESMGYKEKLVRLKQGFFVPDEIESELQQYYLSNVSQMQPNVPESNQKQLDATKSNHMKLENATESNEKQLNATKSNYMEPKNATECNQLQPDFASNLQGFTKSLQDQIDALKQHNELLSEQLKVKDNQISEKDKQIEALTTNLQTVSEALSTAQGALSTAQALHAGTIQQQLLEQSDKPNDTSEDVFVEEEHSKHWWQKIFKKR